MRPSFQIFSDRINCVEVGVGKGDNAFEMLSQLPRAKFFLVDSYDVNNSTFQFGQIFTVEEREKFIETVKLKIAPVENGRVEWLIEDSVIAANRFADEYFDYVYIDAQHEYDAVVRDISAWLPKVRKGGVIGGDDCGVPAVKRAVKDVARKFNMDVTYGATHPDWIAVKK